MQEHPQPADAYGAMRSDAYAEVNFGSSLARAERENREALVASREEKAAAARRRRGIPDKRYD